jgi:hypothetical protein
MRFMMNKFQSSKWFTVFLYICHALVPFVAWLFLDAMLSESSWIEWKRNIKGVAAMAAYWALCLGIVIPAVVKYVIAKMENKSGGGNSGKT